MAFYVDEKALGLDTSPLHGHLYKNRNKSKMVKRKAIPPHPLHKNGMMNFWDYVLKDIADELYEGPQLQVPFAESVIFRSNKAVGWYRWDEENERVIYASAFPESVRKRRVRDADGTVHEEIDWSDDGDDGELGEDGEEGVAQEEVVANVDLLGVQRADEHGEDAEEGYDSDEGEKNDDEDDEDTPYNNQMNLIHRRFLSGLDPSQDIVAVFISDDEEPHDEQVGNKNVTLEYMDAPKLKRFLMLRKPNGVLQRFLEPQGGRATMIQAIWTPYVMIVERRQNVYPVFNPHIPFYHRTVTAAAAEPTLTREVPVPVAVTQEIEEFFLTLSQLLHLRDHKHLYRGVAYFTLRADGALHLLWTSSFELVSVASKPPPVKDKKKKAAMLRVQLGKDGRPLDLLTDAVAAQNKSHPPPNQSTIRSLEYSRTSSPISPTFASITMSRSTSSPTALRQSAASTAAAPGQPHRLSALYNPARVHSSPPPPLPDAIPRFVTPFDSAKPQTFRQVRNRQKLREIRRLQSLEQKGPQSGTPSPGPSETEAAPAPEGPRAARTPSPGPWTSPGSGPHDAGPGARSPDATSPSFVAQADAALAKRPVRLMRLQSKLHDMRRTRRREQGWDSTMEAENLRVSRHATDSIFQVYQNPSGKSQKKPKPVCSRCLSHEQRRPRDTPSPPIIEVESADRDRACTKVQAVYRGYAARKTLAQSRRSSGSRASQVLGYDPATAYYRGTADVTQWVADPGTDEAGTVADRTATAAAPARRSSGTAAGRAAEDVPWTAEPAPRYDPATAYYRGTALVTDSSGPNSYDPATAYYRGTALVTHDPPPAQGAAGVPSSRRRGSSHPEPTFANTASGYDPATAYYRESAVIDRQEEAPACVTYCAATAYYRGTAVTLPELSHADQKLYTERMYYDAATAYYRDSAMIHYYVPAKVPDFSVRQVESGYDPATAYYRGTPLLYSPAEIIFKNPKEEAAKNIQRRYRGYRVRKSIEVPFTPDPLTSAAMS